MSSLKDQVDFSLIRYANCWEDAEVLLQSLDICADDRILIIASAGDNALALLSQSPASLRAVDLSLAQLYLCELKQAAFAQLDHDELLLLLGIGTGAQHASVRIYRKIRNGLSLGARQYWDERRQQFEHGIVHAGKFEHYFKLFRNWLLPLVHRQSTTRELLHPKSDAEQSAFFLKHWNTWRWKALMNFFFSKAIMGRYGRDPQFLKHVSINVPQYIRNKAEDHLQTSGATRNPFLRYMLTGSFEAQLPAYLQEASFARIKANIGRLHIAEGDMDTEVMRTPYRIYCASNIFEYMSTRVFESLADRWSGAVPSGARIAYWNLMAPRSLAQSAPAHWKDIPTDSPDMGFFYSRFILEEKR